MGCSTHYSPDTHAVDTYTVTVNMIHLRPLDLGGLCPHAQIKRRQLGIEELVLLLQLRRRLAQPLREIWWGVGLGVQERGWPNGGGELSSGGWG